MPKNVQSKTLMALSNQKNSVAKSFNVESFIVTIVMHSNLSLVFYRLDFKRCTYA